MLLIETMIDYSVEFTLAMPLSQLFEVLFDSCIFHKNRALAPHERSAVPLGTDHCPVC